MLACSILPLLCVISALYKGTCGFLPTALWGNWLSWLAAAVPDASCDPAWHLLKTPQRLPHAPAALQNLQHKTTSTLQPESQLEHQPVEADSVGGAISALPMAGSRH